MKKQQPSRTRGGSRKTKLYGVWFRKALAWLTDNDADNCTYWTSTSRDRAVKESSKWATSMLRPTVKVLAIVEEGAVRP